MPFVRGAYAAGKLASASGTTGYPAPTTPDQAVQRMGRQGKGRDHDRLHHLARRQAAADRGGRSAGALRARHADLSRLGRRGAGRQRWRRSTTSWTELIAQNGEVPAGIEHRRQAKRALDRGAGSGRQPDTAALRPHRLFQAVCRARPDQDVSGRRAARQGTRGQVDLGLRFSHAAEKCHKGRPCRSACRSASPTTRSHWVGAVFAPTARSWSTRTATSPSSPTRQAGARMVQEARAGAAAECLRVGRCLEQQGADLGPGALIMNPPSAWAVAVRDAPKVAEQLWTFPTAEGAEGPASTPAVPFFWGVWSFSKNKPAAKSLLTYPVAALLGRADRRGEQGLRHPALRQAARFQDLGRGGAAQGHRSTTIRRAATCRSVIPLLRVADQDRQPDLRPGDRAEDDRPVHPAGQDDRPGDRLGGRRARRVSAES